MSKIKTIIVTILVILSCASFVSASSVNMNLAGGNTTATNSNTSATSNMASNELSNGVNEQNTVSGNTITNTNSIAANSNMSTNIESVSSINDVESSSMDISQILNIFLIAVGVILILLAIAILIRMKK